MSPYRATRSAIHRNHALITPESHVRSDMPGWNNSQTIVLIAPALGAQFTQYLALMNAGGTATPAWTPFSRFLYLLEGEVTVQDAATSHTLAPGGYAYFPPNSSHSIEATQASRLLIFEKPYVALPNIAPPMVYISHEPDVVAKPFLGDPDALLKSLLPASPAFDFEINVFTFAPGGSLPLVEVHVMEHGLIFLQGEGIYRLDDQWYPVQTGDVIWMAPFCPQWFAAIGKTPARYLYYKDVNRAPVYPTHTA